MVLVFGKVVGAAGKVAVGIGKIGKLLKTFGSVAGIIASPAGVVIGVLAAIAVATVLVITHWKQIKAAASSAFGYVKGVLEDLGVTSESIKEKLAPLGDKFKVIGDKLKELWTVVSPVVSAIADVFMNVFLVKVGKAKTFCM